MKIKTVKKPLSDIVEQFKEAFAQVNKKLVNRGEELAAVMYCMLCGGHLMLEGPPGVAKSLLARLAFKVIDDEDVTKFHITMMPNTQAEEIFGPMSITKLREQETIEYNTIGMLPSAHFAYINETYRGSDSVLSTMMDILNEKTFVNGRNVQKCPLVTAIGTTNFLSDKPELEAFHDRWLIARSVEPADSPASRRAILDLFLDSPPEEDFSVVDPVTIDDLKRMQDSIRKITVPEAMKELYDEMTDKYRSKVQNESVYVSDRRYCQGMRLVQAAIFIDTNGEPTENPDAQSVTAAKYALLRSRHSEHRDAMDNAITETIGNYSTLQKEEPEIKEFEDFAKRQFEKYDDANPLQEHKKQDARVQEILNRIVTLPPSEQFSHPRNQARLKKVVEKLTELKENLEDRLQKK